MTRNAALRSLAVLFALCASPHPGDSQTQASAAERELFALTNQMRADRHLPQFTWDPALARAARLHAWRIATERGSLEHQYPGEPELAIRAAHAGAHFDTVSENIARRALTPAGLLDAWMHTAPHRATLLNPQLTAIGIGVAEVDGLLSGVQDFSRPVPVLTRDAVEADVELLLHRAGLHPVAITATARSVCESDIDTASGARLILHWQSSDFSQLPPDLLRELTNGSYVSAGVGACGLTPSKDGYTSARVALLLY